MLQYTTAQTRVTPSNKFKKQVSGILLKIYGKLHAALARTEGGGKGDGRSCKHACKLCCTSKVTCERMRRPGMVWWEETALLSPVSMESKRDIELQRGEERTKAEENQETVRQQ